MRPITGNGWVLAFGDASVILRSSSESEYDCGCGMAFQVPCSCGHIIPATLGDAGATVRCPCGRDVVIPNLHALRQLEPAPAQTPRKSHTVDRDVLWRRGTWCAIASVCLFFVGSAALVVISAGDNYTEQVLTEFEFTLVLFYFLFWFGMSATAVFWARAKGYLFRFVLLLLWLFGPISTLFVVLLLPYQKD